MKGRGGKLRQRQWHFDKYLDFSCLFIYFVLFTLINRLDGTDFTGDASSHLKLYLFEQIHYTMRSHRIAFDDMCVCVVPNFTRIISFNKKTDRNYLN